MTRDTMIVFHSGFNLSLDRFRLLSGARRRLIALIETTTFAFDPGREDYSIPLTPLLTKRLVCCARHISVQLLVDQDTSLGPPLDHCSPDSDSGKPFSRLLNVELGLRRICRAAVICLLPAVVLYQSMFHWIIHSTYRGRHDRVAVECGGSRSRRDPCTDPYEIWHPNKPFIRPHFAPKIHLQHRKIRARHSQCSFMVHADSAHSLELAW